jgi:hypothetical protein
MAIKYHNVSHNANFWKRGASADFLDAYHGRKSRTVDLGHNAAQQMAILMQSYIWATYFTLMHRSAT